MDWTLVITVWRDGIALMNNLEITRFLEVAVFGMAIAQMLLIILTIRRERDVNELREVVEEQRLRLTEIRAWLAGRNAGRTASEDEQRVSTDMTVPVSGMPLQESSQQRAAAHLRTTKERDWGQDVVARLQSGVMAQQATTAGFKWFKDDPNEPPEIVEARRVVIGAASESQNRGSPADPATRMRALHTDFSSVEVERTLQAIKSLREETENSSTSLSQKAATSLKR